MYKKILLASDGSPASGMALLEAAKLAREGSELMVLTVVVDPLTSFASPYGLSYDAGLVRNAALESGREALERTVAQLEEMGIKVQGQLLDLTETASTNIAAAILEEAQAWPADVVVIGTHGRGGFKRFFLGSVAETLLRIATLPVLLVRSADTGEKEVGGEWPEKVMGD